MSFVSKNLQQTTNAMSFIKGATLFFLGMSAVLFLTQAFDIVPVATEVKGYFKTIILTSNGSNTAATGIELDGNLGRGHFVGDVDVDSSVNANTVNATTINGITVNGTTVKGTMISGATVRGTTVCVNGECRTSRPVENFPGGNTNNIQFKAGTGFSGTNNLVRDSTNSRLGIKTTTPQTALDVNGGAYFGLDGNNFTLEALQSNTNAFKYDNLNSTISLFEDNDGKVGIGTGSPAYKLDVNGTGRIQNALYFGSIEETQNNYFMPQIYHEYERFYLKGAYSYNSAYNGGDIYIDGGGSAGGSSKIGNILLATSGGKIGIGTGISPDYKLNILQSVMVESEGSSPYGNIYTNNGWYETYLGKWKDEDGSGAGAAANYGMIIHDLSSNGVGLRVIMGNPNGTAAQLMGKVGIGTQSPSAKLTVEGGIKAQSWPNNPCTNTTDFPEGTIFYNNTNHHPCFCGTSSAALDFTGASCF